MSPLQHAVTRVFSIARNASKKLDMQWTNTRVSACYACWIVVRRCAPHPDGVAWRFADVIECWSELAGNEAAATARPVAFDLYGRLTLLIHDVVSPRPTDAELATLAGLIRARVPRIDGVEVQRVMWQRRRLRVA